MSIVILNFRLAPLCPKGKFPMPCEETIMTNNEKGMRPNFVGKENFCQKNHQHIIISILHEEEQRRKKKERKKKNPLSEDVCEKNPKR